MIWMHGWPAFSRSTKTLKVMALPARERATTPAREQPSGMMPRTRALTWGGDDSATRTSTDSICMAWLVTSGAAGPEPQPATTVRSRPARDRMVMENDCKLRLVPDDIAAAAPPAPVAGGPAIRVQGLTKVFRKRTAVDGLTFSIERGRFFGFLGPNGAGKSTTIKMLTGLLRPTAGEVEIEGRS